MVNMSATSHSGAMRIAAAIILGAGAVMLLDRARRSLMAHGATTDTAEDLMNGDPACCSPITTIDEVAQLMRHHHARAVIVIDVAGRPVGLISDRDLVDRVVAEAKNPMAHTAEQSMTHPVVSVRLTTPIDAIVAAIQTHRIGQVVVIDDDGACVGLVTRADVARVTHGPS
jgi:CBS domain-containing protein